MTVYGAEKFLNKLLCENQRTYYSKFDVMKIAADKKF